MNGNSMQVQAEVRRNSEEQIDVLRDLGAWEASMKKRDKKVKLKREQERGSMLLSFDENYIAAEENDSSYFASSSFSDMPSNILNGVPQVPDTAVTVATASNPVIITSTATDRRGISKNNGEEDRLRGNSLYSSGKYEEAIRCYTKSLILSNHLSAVAFSNRAMAYLKLKDWKRAEVDASSALGLDPKHVKSYQRRASARFRLGKIRAALGDIEGAESFLEDCDVMNERTLLSLKKTISLEKKKMIGCLYDIIQKSPRRRIPIVVHEANDLKGEECDVKTQGVLSVRDVKELPVPKRWYEFEANWKILSCNARVAYLEKVKPASLLFLYKHGIEDAQLLSQIIVSASMSKYAISYLNSLCQLPSLDMATLMLTRKQREMIASALNAVERNSMYEFSELRALVRYNV